MANCFDTQGGQLFSNQASLMIAPCDRGIYYDEFTDEVTFIPQEFTLFSAMQSANITPTRTTESIRLSNCATRTSSTIDSVAMPITFLYDPKDPEHEEFADPESFHQVNIAYFPCPAVCGRPDFNNDFFRFGQIAGGVDDLGGDASDTTPQILTATMEKTGRPFSKRNAPGQIQPTPIVPVLTVDEAGADYGPVMITGVSGGTGTYTFYELIITRRDQPDGANTIFISGSDPALPPTTVFDQMGVVSNLIGNGLLGDFEIAGASIDPVQTDVRLVATDSDSRKGTVLVGV